MRMLSLLLVLVLLTGCGSVHIATVTTEEATALTQSVETVPIAEAHEIPYVSRFDTITEIRLSDSSITVNGGKETDAVYTSSDIIYYEDRDTYESGNPYGEGEDWQRHTAEEAAAHTVVNITAPGAYRIGGKLSAGQIRIDLGEDAYDDPNAVVELILSDADITCTVAPAILFLNTYECDGNWSEDTARPDVDTSDAGANLILEGNNTVNGSHVAKIFKDNDKEKKLWKQDGAIYSYMSMNLEGSGRLELNADNEGMDTELHLTLNGGEIFICSGNDGINTNEDGVSVTTINGGQLTIFAGLDKEGDGIDSNGYLVINGGTVISAAHPAADAGLDSDLGSFIHGGTVIAMGSTMDWAESDSKQVTINLQFASQQKAGSKITITGEDGIEIFSFENGGQYARTFNGLIFSAPALKRSETYNVFVDGVQMSYTGTDVGGFSGGFGGRPSGQMPEEFNPSQTGGRDKRPEEGQMPEGFEGFGKKRPEDMDRGEMPEGFEPGQLPEDFEGFGKKRPEGMDRGEMPEGFEPGKMPPGQLPEDFEGFSGPGAQSNSKARTEFYMNDMVNSFSGVKAAD